MTDLATLISPVGGGGEVWSVCSSLFVSFFVFFHITRFILCLFLVFIGGLYFDRNKYRSFCIIVSWKPHSSLWTSWTNRVANSTPTSILYSIFLTLQHPTPTSFPSFKLLWCCSKQTPEGPPVLPGEFIPLWEVRRRTASSDGTVGDRILHFFFSQYTSVTTYP